MTAGKTNVTLYLMLLKNTAVTTKLSPDLFYKVIFFTIIFFSFLIWDAWDLWSGGVENLHRLLEEDGNLPLKVPLCPDTQCDFRHIRFSISIFILIPIWSQTRFITVKFPVDLKVRWDPARSSASNLLWT